MHGLCIDAVRNACIVLSEYKCEITVPEEVWESCAVLICEALKFIVVLDKTIPSLRWGFRLVTLGSFGPRCTLRSRGGAIEVESVSTTSCKRLMS